MRQVLKSVLKIRLRTSVQLGISSRAFIQSNILSARQCFKRFRTFASRHSRDDATTLDYLNHR